MSVKTWNILKMGKDCTRRTRPTAAYPHSSAAGREEFFALPQYNVLHRVAAVALCSLLLCFGAGCDFSTTVGVNSGTQDFKTAQVRYVNLTNSPVSQILRARFTVYNASTRTASTDSVSTAAVGKQQVSAFFVPLSDSAKISVNETGASGAAYNLAAPLALNARNVFYTLIGLPPQAGKSSTNGLLDTIIVLPTFPTDTAAVTASLRFVNCISDTTRTYSFALGCPSGTPVGTSLAYRASSGILPIALNGDNISVALTELSRPISSTATAPPPVVIGLFNLRPVITRGSYTILLYRDASGNPALLALNDRTAETITVSRTSAPSTYLRIANFSSSDVPSVRYGTTDTTATKGVLTTYIPLTACAFVNADTITLRRSNGVQQRLSTSLEVNGSQTLFVGDSVLAIAPALAVTPSTSFVTVRVVNLSSENVTVFRGATTQMRTQQIAGNLTPGSISSAFQMPREPLHPFMVFRPNSSQTLIQQGIDALPSQAAMGISSSYFLVIQDKKMTLVADVPQSGAPTTSNLPPMAKGALVQALHAFADATTATVGIQLGSILRDSVGFGSPRMTVLPVGMGMVPLSIGGSSTMGDLKSDVHYLIVGIGTKDARKVVVERGLWTPDNTDLTPSSVQSTIRYLNATNDINGLRVLSDENGGTFQLTIPLAPDSFSSIARFYSTPNSAPIRTLSFMSDAGPAAFVARNLTFFLGRAYTIIFTGSSNPLSYSVIVLQEF